MAVLREQKASRRWIFRLEDDLEFLEDAYKYGIDMAQQHLAQRLTLLQNQQEVYETWKALAMVNTPEDMLDLLTKQQLDLFAPANFSVLQTLLDYIAEQNLVQPEQLQAIRNFLEESSTTVVSMVR